jgi:uncharacterized membrane protein
MIRRNYPLYPYQPEVGCFLLLVALAGMCLLPFVLLDAATLALTKLHLSPAAAVLVLLGIFFGGLVNFPLYVLERKEEQIVPGNRIATLLGWVPMVERRTTRTIVAVNLGGCLIPLGLALFEFLRLLSAGPSVKVALVAAVAANIAVCFFVARPIAGVGIAMPAFASPAVAVGVVWLLLMPDQFQTWRAPVAFIAGVLGPLIGADLLHLRDITKVSARVVSIGGAGTFDGIVLSGLLAALLA